MADEATNTPGDGQGGEGGEGQQAPNYAGFSTPEELAADYERVNGQVRELEKLKGRQGNELGQLRQEQARLQGLVEGMQNQQAQQQATGGITEESIRQQLEDGDITEAEAISMHGKLLRGEYDQKLQGIQSEFQQFKSETERQKYVDRFLSKPENKGYVEAFDSGKLQPFMDEGLTAEHAWDRYKLSLTQKQLQELNTKAEQAAKEAEKTGIQKGVKLENQKQNAGKVLGGGAGSFQAKANEGPKDRSERIAHARGVLERMRAK